MWMKAHGHLHVYMYIRYFNSILTFHAYNDFMETVWKSGKQKQCGQLNLKLNELEISKLTPWKKSYVQPKQHIKK